MGFFAEDLNENTVIDLLQEQVRHTKHLCECRIGETIV